MTLEAGVFLGHILESIDLVQGYVGHVTKEQFVASQQLQD